MLIIRLLYFYDSIMPSFFLLFLLAALFTINFKGVTSGLK